MKRKTNNLIMQIVWVILLTAIGITYTIYIYVLAPLPKQEQEQLITEVYIEPLEEILPYCQFYDIPLSQEMQCFVNELCSMPEYSFLTPTQLYGIIWMESRFIPDVTSNSGCVGLMQITPRYAESWLNSSPAISLLTIEEREDLYNPRTNIIIGLEALRCWYAIGENLTDTLELYNKGYPYFSMNQSLCVYADGVFGYADQLEGGEQNSWMQKEKETSRRSLVDY